LKIHVKSEKLLQLLMSSKLKKQRESFIVPMSQRDEFFSESLFVLIGSLC